jgi:hypothetical protein
MRTGGWSPNKRRKPPLLQASSVPSSAQTCSTSVTLRH